MPEQKGQAAPKQNLVTFRAWRGFSGAGGSGGFLLKDKAMAWGPVMELDAEGP